MDFNLNVNNNTRRINILERENGELKEKIEWLDETNLNLIYRIEVLEGENESIKQRLEVLEEEVKLILQALKALVPSAGSDINTVHDRLVARAKSQD